MINNLNFYLKKKNNLCCYITPDNPWYLHTKALVPLSLHNNFEIIFIDGIKNFIFISSILLIIRTTNINNTNPLIKSITDPIINLSKKIIDFKDVPYFQIAFTSCFLTFYFNLAEAYGYNKK